jgi:hypothetical protein
MIPFGKEESLINREDIQRLQAVREFPAVSIYAPTHRTYPDNQQDPVRVRNLVKEAKDRLAQESEDREATGALSETLDELVETIDFEHGLDSVALFAGSGVAEVHYLPFRLEPRVTIDETFATRNLLYVLNRTPRYRVVLLSEKPARVFDGFSDYLEEHVDGRFPLLNEGPSGEGPVKGTPLGHSGRRDERHREFFREVARRLGEIHAADPLPIVLVGIVRYQAFFREVGRNLADQVLAAVDGSYDKTPAHELGALVWPRVLEWVEARKAERLEVLERAVGAGRSASGIEQVWRVAREGRGGQLLVEENYVQPARVSDDGMSIQIGKGPGGPGSLDDAVDEIVETVYSMGGEVSFVEPGSLEKHQKIALILRY